MLQVLKYVSAHVSHAWLHGINLTCKDDHAIGKMLCGTKMNKLLQDLHVHVFFFFFFFSARNMLPSVSEPPEGVDN